MTTMNQQPGIRALVTQEIERSQDKLSAIVYQGDTQRIARASQQLMIALGENKELSKCSPHSLVLCVRDSLELGLDLSKKLGHAYIVPYGTTAQLIIGYRGMIELAGRAGITINAGVVHEHDGFVWQVGTESRCIHTPSWKDRGDPVGAFAVATLMDGRTLQERMSWDEIDAIRRKSRAGNSGPWIDFPQEMAKKTVIRRLFKTLPTTTNLLMRAAEIDRDELIDTTAREVEQPKQLASRTDEAKARLGIGRQQQQQPEPEEAQYDEEPQDDQATPW